MTIPAICSSWSWTWPGQTQALKRARPIRLYAPKIKFHVIINYSDWLFSTCFASFPLVS